MNRYLILIATRYMHPFIILQITYSREMTDIFSLAIGATDIVRSPMNYTRPLLNFITRGWLFVRYAISHFNPILFSSSP